MKRDREWEQSESIGSIPDGKRISSETTSKVVSCPYLDTINRHLLDFDSEKLCSVTLNNRNVYACLVCGRYYEGRGKSTPAYTHSLEHNHCVFMNIESGRAFCLPDSYEIFDQSLSDIRRSLQPRFSLRDISVLDHNSSLARDVHNVTYLPGYIGLNNLGSTDDINAALHMLAHVSPLRDFFLQPNLYATAAVDSKLVKDFGLLMRKMWSADNFKSTISPQEFVQTLSVESKRRFTIGKRCEVGDLFIWLLHNLQRRIDSKEKQFDGKRVLFEPLQGLVQVDSQTKLLVDGFAEQQILEVQSKTDVDSDGWSTSSQRSAFTFLSLDIPPCPLFRDSQGGLVIPQIPLFQLLQKKFGGEWFDSVSKQGLLRKQYKLLSLPQTLVLQLSRFTRNNFSFEKNPTIVTFPVKNLEMRDYLAADALETDEYRQLQSLLDRCPKRLEDVDAMEDPILLQRLIRELGASLHKRELDDILQRQLEGFQLLAELKLLTRRAVERVLLSASTKYDLVSCVCHVSDNAARGIDVGELNLTAAYGENVLGNSSAMRRRTKAAANAALNEVDAEEIEMDADVVQRGVYKTYLSLSPTGQWFELQDLSVTETSAQQVGVSEAYILVYQKKLSV